MTEERPLAFLAPVPAETAGLRRRLSAHREMPGNDEGASIVAACLEERVVLLAHSGPGSDRAARAVHRLAALPRHPAVIVVGTAGGLDPALREGDVVICTEALGEFDSSGPKPDEDLLDAVHLALVAGDLEVKKGPTVTVSRLANAAAKAALLKEHPKALAVNMEDRGAGLAAAEASLPWISVRVILDPANSSLPEFATSLIDADGQPRYGKIAGSLFASIFNPSRVKEMINFGLTANRVSERVADVISIITRNARKLELEASVS